MIRIRHIHLRKTSAVEHRHLIIGGLLPHANGGQAMKKTTRFGAAPVVLLLTVAPGHADSCQGSIDRVQAQADAVIAKRAGEGPWVVSPVVV